MNCRSHQISETVIRSIVGTNIAPRSQQLVLINQRGRRILSFNMSAICVSMCSLSPSLSVLFVDADRRYSGVDLHSHTHSFSLSVSPLPCLSFFPLKRCCDTLVIIIEIQDSIVFGCSHFIKVALIRNWCHRIGMKSLCQD